MRITTKKKKDPLQEQLNTRRMIKSDINQAKTAYERHKLEDKLQKIEEEITTECETKNYEKIKEQLLSISNKNGTTTRNIRVKKREKKMR